MLLVTDCQTTSALNALRNVEHANHTVIALHVLTITMCPTRTHLDRLIAQSVRQIAYTAMQMVVLNAIQDIMQTATVIARNAVTSARLALISRNAQNAHTDFIHQKMMLQSVLSALIQDASCATIKDSAMTVWTVSI